MYNVVGNIFAYCVNWWHRATARGVQSTFTRSAGIVYCRAFRCSPPVHISFIYSYTYIYIICEYIILIHSNRRSGHHCVRKSNLFHIYTRLKSPPRTEFDDIGRRVLYARLYILYYRHGQWKLAMSMNPVYYTLRCTPAHNNLVCVYKYNIIRPELIPIIVKMRTHTR